MGLSLSGLELMSEGNEIIAIRSDPYAGVLVWRVCLCSPGRGCAALLCLPHTVVGGSG